MFSIGCNHGGEPTVIRSHITSIDRYLNAPNIEVAGMPVLGRSGGGLFTKDGRLIGVCNAADEVDNEGIYAGLASLHWQLDRIGLSRVYQPGAAPTPASDAATASGVEVAADISNLPARGAEVTIGAPAAGNEETDVRAAVAEAAISVSSGASAQELLTALRDGDEVICVIRRRDQREARAVVLDGSSRELLSRLAREIQSDVVPQSIETATRAVQSLGNIAMPQ